jgi:hypothetical protein
MTLWIFTGLSLTKVILGQQGDFMVNSLINVVSMKVFSHLWDYLGFSLRPTGKI